MTKQVGNGAFPGALLLLLLLLACEPPISAPDLALPLSPNPGPSGLSATLGVATATIEWQTDSKATGYRLECSEDPAFPPAATTVFDLVISSYTQAWVGPGKTYHYRVASVRSEGVSQWSTTKVEAPESWTWQRVRLVVGPLEHQKVDVFELGNDEFAVFVTTWELQVYLVETLSVDQSGVSLATFDRTVDRQVGTETENLSDSETTFLAGTWDGATGALAFDEKFANGDWTDLETPETHSLAANADRTQLVLDGDASQSFELVL